MVAEAPSIERSLRTSRLLAGVDESVLAALGQAAFRKTFARGESLWRAGEPALNVAIISSGFVKIVRHTADGTSCILGIFCARESMGEAAVMGRGIYPAEAVAASEVVHVVYVRASQLLAIMDTSRALSHAVNRSLTEHTMALQAKIEVLSAGAVEQRLATLLVHLAERFGDEFDDGTASVPLALTRAELASLVGTTVETTIRTMSRWQKAGFLTTSEEGFKIHQPLALKCASLGKASGEGTLKTH